MRLDTKSEIFLDEDYVITGLPYFGFDPNCMTLFIRNIPKNCGTDDLLNIFKDLKGFVNLS